MDDYNLWKDLLDTFQSSADWIKALMIIVPPAFLLGVLALFLNFRLRVTQVAEDGPPPGQLYPVVRDDGRWKILEDSEPEKLVLSGRIRTRTRH